MEKSTDLKVFRNDLNNGHVENFLLAEEFYFRKSDEQFMARILSCEFLKMVTMGGLTNSDSVLFEDCKFESSVLFTNNTFDKGLIFKNCRFNGEVIITDCEFNRELTFIDCEFKSELRIFSCSVDQLNFNSGKFLIIQIMGKLNSQRDMGLVNFKKIFAESVQITCTEFNSNLFLIGGEVERFCLIDSVINGEIRVDGSELILGNLIFHSCKLHSRIDIRNCIIVHFLKFTKVVCIDELLINEYAL